MMYVRKRNRENTTASGKCGLWKSSKALLSGRLLFMITVLCFILTVNSLKAQPGEQLFRTDIEQN
jgi:hypothetical protein